jgi:hypothetical protein
MNRFSLAVAVLRQEAARIERHRQALEEIVRPCRARPIDGQPTRFIWYTATLEGQVTELAAVVVQLQVRAEKLEGCGRFQEAAHGRLGARLPGRPR